MNNGFRPYWTPCREIGAAMPLSCYLFRVSHTIASIPPSGLPKRPYIQEGVFSLEKWSASPLFSAVWRFSKISRISKFSRMSREWTFPKRHLLKDQFSPNPIFGANTLWGGGVTVPNEIGSQIAKQCRAPWKPSFFSGLRPLWCIAFPDLWCIPFSLVSQRDGIYTIAVKEMVYTIVFICSVASGSGDRPREGGAWCALFIPEVVSHLVFDFVGPGVVPLLIF